MKNRRRITEKRMPLAEINIIPFVDVMLVLLVTFMVTAPLLQMGLDVNLPQVKAQPLDVSETKIVLTVKENGEVYINKLLVQPNELGTKLKAIFSERADREIFLRADTNVPYGTVARVMGEAHRAGLRKLAMITDEPQQRSR